MVLWEVTLATAYFLGLKKTYKLALQLQRRLIGPNHPRIRDFAYRRTRAVFDMAVTVHKKVQERDLEVGRNLGNWILRWLDRMKPSAQIRAIGPGKGPSSTGGNPAKHVPKYGQPQPPKSGERSSFGNSDSKSKGRRLFASSMSFLPKSRPTWMKRIQPYNPISSSTQYRNLSTSALGMSTITNGISRKEGVIRKDIMQWMLRN
ncbi:hypothetical protein MKW92_047949 [Papaver armeniacum]|nr:hypothetical protein MKW92_047027 [Papaver armeniacum]KAI3924979.1 hypothetical protein MKW92_047949 [Papaver armeniacum]